MHLLSSYSFTCVSSVMTALGGRFDIFNTDVVVINKVCDFFVAKQGNPLSCICVCLAFSFKVNPKVLLGITRWQT